MTAWDLAGLMSDTALERPLDDLQAVPALPEALAEAYSDGRWLYEPSCARCGIPRDRRRPGCVCCRWRHQKRRERVQAPARGSVKARPAPLLREAA